MSFSRLRPSGAYTPNSIALSAEFEQLDQNQSEAIDGTAGGTYAPAAEINIGGAGINLTGASSAVSGTLTVNGFFVIASTGTLQVNTGGAITLATGTTWTLNGTASITTGAGTFTWAASSTSNFNGAVVFNSTVTFGAASTLTFDSGGTLDYNGVTTTGKEIRTGALIRSGFGAYVGKRYHSFGALGAGSTTITAEDYDFYTFGNLSGPHTIQLNDPPAGVNVFARFTGVGTWGGFTLAIADSSGTPIALLDGTPGRQMAGVLYHAAAGAWHPVMRGDAGA